MAWVMSVRAREVLDSRGNPTLEVDVSLDDGAAGVQPCRRERRPAAKRSSCATAIPIAFAAWA